MNRTFRNLVLLVTLCAPLSAQRNEPSAAVEFTGNKVFSSQVLSSKFGACYSRSRDLGSEADDRLISYCLQTDVLNHIRSQGYLEAKISAPVQKEKKLVIDIEEGLRFRLGRVNITGSSIFTPRKLLEGLDLKSGDIANGPQLQEWAWRHINDLYDDLGHVQSISDLEVVFKHVAGDPAEGIADINLEIVEGPSFKVRKVAFVGNVVDLDQVLRRTMMLRTNEVFRKKDLVESIRRLNELGLFEPVDPDRDVELHIDTESPTLDIRIKLRRISAIDS